MSRSGPTDHARLSILTTDENADASDLKLETRLNGEDAEKPGTFDLVFNVPELIANSKGPLRAVSSSVGYLTCSGANTIYEMAGMIIDPSIGTEQDDVPPNHFRTRQRAAFPDHSLLRSLTT